MSRKTFLSLAIGLLLAGTSQAAVKPHNLISDGAVLQQGLDVPVWGTAKDGEKVTVKFQDQEVSTTAKDGRWSVKLKPLKPGGPFVMTITGENTVEVKNILVGEVWIGSGQSNMEFGLFGVTNAAAVMAAANDPLLRLCTIPPTFQAEPQRDVATGWKECTPENVRMFSAVAYFFGRDLRKALGVPVGLIHSSVGGTPAQAWTSTQTLAANPLFRAFFDGHAQGVSNYFAKLAIYQQDEPKLMEKWKADADAAKTAGKPLPPKPEPPANPVNRGPGCLYNGMIAPLQPYAIRGVIWYQGESNVNNPQQYQTLFPTLIKDWRDAWGIGDFPFLFVQIAPFRTMVPELREAQLLTWQKTPKTAMAVITDCGSALNIHPVNKEPVGARLALAARAVAYGEKIEYSGPVYDSLKIDGDKAIVSFTHIGSGLEARGGELKGFALLGSGTNVVNATAKIEGDKVVVTSPEVANPVAVRYGWTTVPDVNLYNREGLPATPFRSDIPK